VGNRIGQSFGSGVVEAFSDPLLAFERAKLVTKNPDANLPEYFSGARCKLLVDGKTIGAALEVSWSVSAQMMEVRTIDSFSPWEIVPGQLTIKASLKRIVDPRRSLGGDGLYSTMTSYLHQPYSSIEIRDRLGNVIFLARGMFTDLQGNVANGQLGVESISFMGYYWRENVSQEFSPQKLDFLDALKNRFTQNSLVKKIGG